MNDLNAQYEYVFTSVETHTVGEPTRIITSGFPECVGTSMMEKKQYLEQHYDHLRSALMCEPRGHDDMVGALIVPKTNEQAHIGVIFMDSERWVNMCGHATIGCATFALESGLVAKSEPYTDVVIDTPVGMIPTVVKVEAGKVTEVTITNVPSFLFQDHVEVNIDGITYEVAISFGGTFFALVNAQQFPLKLVSKDIEFLIPFTKKLLHKLNEQIVVKHPELDIERVVNAEYYISEGKYKQRNIVIAEEGQVDRSPCGTGTSAKLAYLYATDHLSAKEIYTNESFTGAAFKGVFEETLTIGTYSGIRPLITGSAYITGKSTFVIDEKDPVKYGFHI